MQPVEVTGTLGRYCAGCRASELEAQLMSCGRCRMKWYCSRACQKAHWKLGHKLYCVQVSLLSLSLLSRGRQPRA